MEDWNVKNLTIINETINESISVYDKSVTTKNQLSSNKKNRMFKFVSSQKHLPERLSDTNLCPGIIKFDEFPYEEIKPTPFRKNKFKITVNQFATIPISRDNCSIQIASQK